MPSTRKFYETKVTVVILSEDPLSENLDWGQIDEMIVYGDCSGKVEIGESKERTAVEIVKLLKDQHTDPTFFELDEDGEEMD